jgi:hypothetical protein
VQDELAASDAENTPEPLQPQDIAKNIAFMVTARAVPASPSCGPCPPPKSDTTKTITTDHSGSLAGARISASTGPLSILTSPTNGERP